MLELRNVQFTAGSANIVQDVSLTIPEGRFVVITGPNGGGKTTLAKLIMGLQQPTGGAIIWNGEDVTNMSITERAQRGISYGFQAPPRFKGIRVSDLLRLAAGKEKNLSIDQCCTYLTKVGLCARDYVNRDVDSSLSGGELKRIEIATILARGNGREHTLMIFDEPEAGIDLWSFAKLTDTFKALHATGTATIIIISHQERIIQLADEIVMVSGGKVSAQGSVEEIFPLILKDTVGVCTMAEKEGL